MSRVRGNQALDISSHLGYNNIVLVRERGEIDPLVDNRSRKDLSTLEATVVSDAMIALGVIRMSQEGILRCDRAT